jgi:hypothetical protein
VSGSTSSAYLFSNNEKYKGMKNIANTLKVALIVTLFTGWGLVAMAQGPPPPPGGGPNNGHGATGDQPAGGGAPIGSAVALMVGLFGAYGAKKVWDGRKKLDE